MFVAIEGPNGVGKSSIVSAVVGLLEPHAQVLSTAEPTKSPLGLAIRRMEGLLSPRALGLACVADRLDHIEREIVPALERGAWVVSDRYVPSSLVLQRLDGFGIDVVWAWNRDFRVPDAVIYLEDSPETIAGRLSIRARQSRLEGQGGPDVELAYYRDAYTFLQDRNWRQIWLSCAGKSVEDVAREVVERLLEIDE